MRENGEGARKGSESIRLQCKYASIPPVNEREGGAVKASGLRAPFCRRMGKTAGRLGAKLAIRRAPWLPGRVCLGILCHTQSPGIVDHVQARGWISEHRWVSGCRGALGQLCSLKLKVCKALLDNMQHLVQPPHNQRAS